MFRRYMPLMCAISACLILCAVPFTRLFFRDPAEAVYGMTVWGFRILPLCMPLSLITLHFICYAQASGKTGLVNLLAALDGVVCVAGFSALLIRSMGINGVYSANVLNGIVCLVAVVAYSWRKIKHFPRNMEQARKLVREVDKDRSSYYRYYTDQVWGERENYDLILSSAKIGVDGCVKLICEYLGEMKL